MVSSEAKDSAIETNDFALWQRLLSRLASSIAQIIASSLKKLSIGIHAPPQPGEMLDCEGVHDDSHGKGMTANMFGPDGDDEDDEASLEDTGIIAR
jgi:hypothetical protein